PTHPAVQATRLTKPIVQTSIFDKGKTIVQPAIKPIVSVKAAPAPQPPLPKPEPKKQDKPDPYSNMRFFNF
ncbi:MAG: hypothetical protein PHH14_02030, partial [Candidatus Margulisbacteria bacterium]|nr:hypothetical protein [Candidatus Margulisiibacteriota bacterium]